ncbi:cellulase family glycosylhydrolase [Gordonia shandongensis]|uniref:endoglycoceramidase I n=1 Tax=Gordonia shandongensis TaxID=376351 RepID=UPI00040301E4|nr:cellulase family glycosylhydrolase [Gordonia shandongensis]
MPSSIRRALASIVALIVAVSATVVTSVPGPADAAPTGDLLGPLGTRGERIVDEHGRTVLIHGVNNVDKQAPYIQPGDGLTLTARDAKDLARQGFNAVRLGISFDGLMPTRGRVDTAYVDRVVDVVDTLAAEGIRTLLDNHQDGLSSVWGGNGFPSWSIKARPSKLEPNPGFPLYYIMPSMNLAWDEVWTNRYGVLDHLGTALAALTSALKGHRGVMGVELLNEPWPGTAAPTCFPFGCPVFDRQYQRAMEKLTRYVRGADARMPVYWEPNVTWNQLMPSNLGRSTIRSSNVVFAPHDYCIASQLAIYLGLPEEFRALCTPQHDLTWRHLDDFRARTGRPALVTEFGDGDPTVLNSTLTRADSRRVGWMYWHYSSRYTGSTVGSDPLAGEAGRLLVRTYPQATAGRPESLSFDATTGAFDYTYRPDRSVSAPTVVYVSSRHYPRGYTVRVDGGTHRVTSDGRLLISADGTSPVRVRVTAK